MAEFSDMNGLWSGWYSYSVLSERVPFTAWFDETAGLLTGSIMEPNTFSALDIEDLQADIAGTRSGQDVLFSKTYGTGQGVHQYPISYSGRASGDFRQVGGTWSIGEGANGAGPFELTRASRGMSEGILREVMVSVGSY